MNKLEIMAPVLAAAVAMSSAPIDVEAKSPKANKEDSFCGDIFRTTGAKLKSAVAYLEAEACQVVRKNDGVCRNTAKVKGGDLTDCKREIADHDVCKADVRVRVTDVLKCWDGRTDDAFKSEEAARCVIGAEEEARASKARRNVPGEFSKCVEADKNIDFKTDVEDFAWEFGKILEVRWIRAEAKRLSNEAMRREKAECKRLAAKPPKESEKEMRQYCEGYYRIPRKPNQHR